MRWLTAANKSPASYKHGYNVVATPVMIIAAQARGGDVRLGVSVRLFRLSFVTVGSFCVPRHSFEDARRRLCYDRVTGLSWSLGF